MLTTSGLSILICGTKSLPDARDVIWWIKKKVEQFVYVVGNMNMLQNASSDLEIWTISAIIFIFAYTVLKHTCVILGPTLKVSLKLVWWFKFSCMVVLYLIYCSKLEATKIRKFYDLLKLNYFQLAPNINYCNNKLAFKSERRQRSGIDKSTTTPDPGYHMGKWQKHNYKQTRAEGSALSKQVTTRQPWTDAKAWKTQDINNTKWSTKEEPPWNGQ